MSKAWVVRSARAMVFVPLSLWIALGADALRPEPFAKSAMTPALTESQQRASSPQQKVFRAAGVISASDVKYPLDTTADGIVVFNVSLDASGAITNINALTDIPPLTNVAQSALQSWKFIPASFGGLTEASQMLVAFVFRHAVKAWNPPVFDPVFAAKEQAGYVPAGIFTASYADYPASTIAAGVTVVEVTIKADGIISAVKVVREMSGGFVPLAVKAARQWEFEPAMLNGSPVMSKIAIAFVFSSRALNPF